MSGQKLSPRQKMINMMYLVLTALLAMNVSKEVLNAFKIVGNGIQTSNSSIQKRNLDYYSAFDDLKNKDETQDFLKLYALSTQTKILTNDALSFITAIQDEIKMKSGIVIENGREEFKRADDLNTSTKILTSSNEGKSKGEELRIQLDSLRSAYLEIIDLGNGTLKGSAEFKDYPTLYASVLPLKSQPENIMGLDNEKKSWAEFNFGNVPVIASDVILEKLKNDIINTETQVLEYLLQQANGDIIEFDILEAKVIAPKSYLASGKTYEADIFISAASSQTNMEVFVGKVAKESFGEKKKLFVENQDLPFLGDYKEIEVENGKAKFEEQASGVGSKAYEGIVRVKKPTGGFELYPFYADYEVAPPSGMSVSATKMNVLYIGVDNPIQIAVNGAKSDADVNASITQGKLSKNGSGQYVARVTTPGVAKINVSANVNDKIESFAPMEFRVLKIPDPDISLCGFALKNKMSKAEITSCNGLIAQNEQFIFETVFSVISYEVIIQDGIDVKRVNISGPGFSNELNNLLKNLKKKNTVVFDNIVVKDPAQKNRKIKGSIFIEVV